MLLILMKQKFLLIFTTFLLFATACSTITDDEIAELRAELQEVETELAELKAEDSGAEDSGRQRLLQEILAAPELGIGRDLAECFIDYVVDNSPLDFEQWNTLGDDYPVSTEALEGLSQEEMEDLVSVVATGVEDCGLFDEEYEDADGGDYSPPVIIGEFNFEILSEHPLTV